MAQAKKVTSMDVARVAGVSQSTVSMILNQSPGMSFSQDTIDRVLLAAQELGYQKRASKNRKLDCTRNIVVVCPGFMNPYYTMIIEAIQEVCLRFGFGVFTYCTLRLREQEERLQGLLSAISAAGVIYAYMSPNIDIMQRICEQLPTIIIGDKDSAVEADAVELNSVKCGMAMAEHLISLGHRKIAFVTTPLENRQLARRRRLQGMQMKFEEHGITDGIVVKQRTNIREDEVINMFTEYSTGYDLTREVIKDNEGVTAIAGLNDMFALGAMDAVLDEKLRIPQDYSVIGCDNNIITRLRKISLTTVEHYSIAKGGQAAELLIRKITAPEEGGVTPPSIMRVEYEPRIVVRESTGVCRQRRKG